MRIPADQNLTQAASQPKTFEDRDHWLRAMNASGEPRGARCLAFAIALHLFVETGQCNPGHNTLSKDAGISERSVERFVALLVRKGWLAIKRGGRGHTNNYVLLRPASNLADQEHNRPAGNLADQDFDPPVSAHMIRQNERHDPPHAGGQRSGKAKKEKKREKDSPAENLAAPKKAKKISGEAKGQRRKKSAADAAGFEQFWAAYPRKVAKEAARRAYAKACEAGASHAVLLAGAARYAAERHAEPPRFTKHPATWLNAGCWQDEPIGAPVIDQHGNVVGYEQPREQPRGMVEIGEALAQEYERKGGW